MSSQVKLIQVNSICSKCGARPSIEGRKHCERCILYNIKYKRRQRFNKIRNKIQDTLIFKSPKTSPKTSPKQPNQPTKYWRCNNCNINLITHSDILIHYYKIHSVINTLGSVFVKST